MDSQFKIKRFGHDEPEVPAPIPVEDNVEEVSSSEPVVGEGEAVKKPFSLTPPGTKSGLKVKRAPKGAVSEVEAGQMGCPSCQSIISIQAVMCTECGFNLTSGQQLKTKVELSPKRPGKSSQRTGTTKKSGTKKILFLNPIFIGLVVLVVGGYFMLVKPALVKAREKAVAAKCKSQLKMIGIAHNGGGMSVTLGCPNGSSFSFYNSSSGFIASCPEHEYGIQVDGAVVPMPANFSAEPLDDNQEAESIDGLIAQNKKKKFSDERKKFKTTLLEKDKVTDPSPVPPKGIFNLVQYSSPIGKMDAYISPKPADNKKHPIVIWVTGGFGNGIGESAWSDYSADDDQSASQYRKNGILMMYPSFRGGSKANAGYIETHMGEVDDCLAAIDYAGKLPYVDKSRIYLGGHSTGGTLVLLVAAAAERKVRAVFSFGPVDDVRGYGQENLTFDVNDDEEWRYRAPILWLSSIKAKTFVMEGHDGNYDSLVEMKNVNKNSRISFYGVKGQGHFSILGPMNERIARAIKKDTGFTCNLKFPFK